MKVIPLLISLLALAVSVYFFLQVHTSSTSSTSAHTFSPSLRQDDGVLDDLVGNCPYLEKNSDRGTDSEMKSPHPIRPGATIEDCPKMGGKKNKDKEEKEAVNSRSEDEL